jgi:hypothetical protein
LGGIHDWGTHNLTEILEGYVTFPASWSFPSVYQSALYLLPGSCAQVYIDGNLVQSQCGYPMFSSGSNANHIDWKKIRDATDVPDQNGNKNIPLYSLSQSTMNDFNWVNFKARFFDVLISVLVLLG